MDFYLYEGVVSRFDRDFDERRLWMGSEGETLVQTFILQEAFGKGNYSANVLWEFRLKHRAEVEMIVVGRNCRGPLLSLLAGHWFWSRYQELLWR